jgi:hypothetical protein
MSTEPAGSHRVAMIIVIAPVVAVLAIALLLYLSGK